MKLSKRLVVLHGVINKELYDLRCIEWNNDDIDRVLLHGAIAYIEIKNAKWWNQ